MYVCIYVRTYIRMYIYMHACVYVCMCVYIYIYIYTHTHTHTHVCIYVCTNVCIYVYMVYMYVSMVCACMYGWMKHFTGLEMWVAVVCLWSVAPYILISQSVQWLADSWLAGAQLQVRTVRLTVTCHHIHTGTELQPGDRSMSNQTWSYEYMMLHPHSHLHLIHIPGIGRMSICMCFFLTEEHEYEVICTIYSAMYNI